MFPIEKIQTKLADYCQSLPFDVSNEKQQLLVKFLEMIHKWNKAYNLTSVRDPLDMVAVHLVDSIAVSPYVQGKRFIDVGTGPGLPGVPLSIMLPDSHFVLLDSLGKRIRFLKQVAFELKLANIEPVQSRVEDYTCEQGFDGVITRAYASIDDMLNSCQHLVDQNGVFIALKGQYPEQEIQAIPEGFALQESHVVEVPGLEAQRHVIMIKKQ
ncbi:16S rRNA (guanine(527)-N(7))-methyltransferase RsmG [Paraneptunicella aestuarii]|uniref:16S rRNA (guanine(527)-N(7))-methyltransferase RsmG n=1 Tax=Paraneptunicella aestuarii TaxID=2831148 RepID=UPI001E2EAE46|nr:16S rRNA (guanine(527)-N(7))-methyltransferase RsmG [Paraneptunicella aestuarii]UAA38787.1 16S rRNA (guanine(527)-N(7))-methyltransferase RsmG [Paraneptunicella aestuarii]